MNDINIQEINEEDYEACYITSVAKASDLFSTRIKALKTEYFIKLFSHLKPLKDFLDNSRPDGLVELESDFFREYSDLEGAVNDIGSYCNEFIKITANEDWKEFGEWYKGGTFMRFISTGDYQADMETHKQRWGETPEGNLLGEQWIRE